MPIHTISTALVIEMAAAPATATLPPGLQRPLLAQGRRMRSGGLNLAC